MSTVVVVRKNGAVALAADTLWKDGSVMQRASLVANHSKIVQVADSLIAVTGSSAWSHVLKDYFAKLKQLPNLDGVEAIFAAIMCMHPVLKDRYGINPDDGDNDSFESSRFCFLLANRHGAFAIYPDRGVCEVSTFYAFGTGGRLALGAMHVAYQSMANVEEIAKAGVEAAAEFDEDTGLPVEVFRVELSPGRKGKRTT